MVKSALICGITGQDGAYLAEYLIAKNYEVWGTSRRKNVNEIKNIQLLSINVKIKMICMHPGDFKMVLNAVQVSKPDEIYYLAGQSSVGLSFRHPIGTFESIAVGSMNILEAIRKTDIRIRVFIAGSSECFGDTNGEPADENTPFNPTSPYGVAKSASCWLVKSYRESYGLFATTGILFNHESPLRSTTFVTQKIISAAREIHKGQRESLTLGRLDVARDWGWAPEYVNAMWLMLQQSRPDDFVIATGVTNSLETFVKLVFKEFDLDWKLYVEQSEEHMRPNEITMSVANPTKAKNVLGWSAQLMLPDVVHCMAHSELAISSDKK